MSNNKHIKKCLQDGFTRVAGYLSPVFVHQARRFRRDETGTIAIIFALSVLIIVGLVGGAVDYGRWINAKSKQQAALDSAVLAAGRAYQVTYGNTATALNTANQYYSRLKSHWLSTDNTTFSFASTGETVSGVSDGTVSTPFLAVAGVPKLPVYVTAQATMAAGGNSDSSVEISVMLDVTGSMGGQKIEDLKAAAKDLIDIAVWDDQSEYTSHVAIAPFSEQVNVGRDYYQAVTGNAAPGWGTSQTCVRERSTFNRYTDAAPGPGDYFDAGPTWGTCRPQSAIMPLSNNKSELKSYIDTLSTNGRTAGHIGTAWAWYLLSPKWNNVWNGAATASAYGTKTRKIAILMTDGEYNQEYSGPSSRDQARTLCSNMKEAGITVYTVGFQLSSGGDAYNTLLGCASDSSYFFNSTTGDELRQAFREIALQLVKLRLSL